MSKQHGGQQNEKSSVSQNQNFFVELPCLKKNVDSRNTEFAHKWCITYKYLAKTLLVTWTTKNVVSWGDVLTPLTQKLYYYT